MTGKSLADHVMCFEGVLAPAECAALIARFEASPAQERLDQEAGPRFTQLNVTHAWPDRNDALVRVFLSIFEKYQAAVGAQFWPPQFAFENLRLKRYSPGGVDSFPVHVDVVSQTTATRFVTAILYLNAIEGGETVFPELGLSFAPAPGRLIAFPTNWLFPHAGLPPKSGPKYILHTYLHYPQSAPPRA